MIDPNGFRVTALLGLFTLAAACGDDRGGGGGEGASGSESASETDGDSQAEAGGMEQGGDGDGDGAPGDGDGAPGDGDGAPGDGDGSPGDGDGAPGDGDGSPGDGDGSPGDGDGDGDACEESEGILQPIPPSVMFLLDRSGSMNNTGFDPNNPDKTRWNVLYESVEVVVSGDDANIAFGAKTFSTYNFGECGVSDDPDVPIALNNADAILAGIPGPLEFIVGGTPTNLAIEKTLAIMQAFDSQDGSKIVFLLTDGGIGCTNNPQQALADAVADLSGGFNNDDITTYVVGIAPGNSNTALTQLHQMGLAGGAPKPGPEAFYRADDADELADALATIVADSYGKSCVMNLDQAPMFPDFTKVVIGNTEYDLVNDCDTEDGFIYTNMDYTQIRVCGAACDQLQNEQQALVQFFCMLQ